jgi:hypothetical protein
MADAFEYKVRHRTHKRGAPYESADDFLNNYGPDGWEVCAVALVPAFFISDELYEIFYLKRKAKPLTEVAPT